MTQTEKFAKLNGIKWHKPKWRSPLVEMFSGEYYCECCGNFSLYKDAEEFTNPTFTDAKSILEVMMKREDFIVFIVHLQNDLGYAEIDYRALPIDYILNPDKLLDEAIKWCEVNKK